MKNHRDPVEGGPNPCLNFAEGVPTEELCGSLLTLAAATALAAEELRIARAAVRLHRVPVSLAGVS